MSNVRKTTISNPEKQFLIKNLKEWTRLDGRAFDEFRDLKIKFGKDWGCCDVSLGKTRVLAQVSCELQQPKSSRPSEGILNINLELNSMGDPNFESGRQSELSSQLNRLLEKCIKDSKAVDLESLCVKMNERVWSFRVDINLINHEGNILDCSSIAALAALAHFRRPDVTCDGIEYIIHSLKERDPIPTVIHHYPVCISYAIFCAGEFIIADPSLLEEGVADAFLSIGLNSYKELCGLHLGGKVELSTSTILETTSKASKKASELIEQIKNCVDTDTQLKLTAQKTGFTVDEQIVPATQDLKMCLEHWQTVNKSKKKKEAKPEPEPEIEKLEEDVAELVPKEGWDVVESDEEEEEVQIVEPHKEEVLILSGSGSEEDEVMVLGGDNGKKMKKKKKRKA